MYQAEDHTCKDTKAKEARMFSLVQKTGISVCAGSGKKGDY